MLSVLPKVTLLGLGERWYHGCFVLRSGAYAGRPPSLADLDSEILEMTYNGLHRDVGHVHSVHFVRMVNNLDDLSASSFIVAFERFWNGGCIDTAIYQEKVDRITLSARDDALTVEAMCTIASSFFHTMTESQIYNISWGIKRPFILTHLAEIPHDERREQKTVTYAF